MLLDDLGAVDTLELRRGALENTIATPPPADELEIGDSPGSSAARPAGKARSPNRSRQPAPQPPRARRHRQDSRPTLPAGERGAVDAPVRRGRGPPPRALAHSPAPPSRGQPLHSDRHRPPRPRHARRWRSRGVRVRVARRGDGLLVSGVSVALALAGARDLPEDVWAEGVAGRCSPWCSPSRSRSKAPPTAIAALAPSIAGKKRLRLG
jgi:hypothetical protein